MSLAKTLDKINPLLKKTNFAISFLLLVVVFFALMIHLSAEVRDLDLWLHLKTGEQIILNKTIPLTDPYSFTKEGWTWINHEWLFQIITYTVFSQFGFDGLILVQNIVFLIIFLFMFRIGFRKKNYLFASVMLFILLLNASYRFTIRPDMFSVLFLVLFIFILKEKPNYIFLLPPLQILWTNFHGFFFIGPLIIFIFAATEKKTKLWIIFLLSLIATTINPQFIKGAIYPITTLFHILKDRFILDFIQELKKPLTIKTVLNFKDWPFYKSLIIISIFGFRFNQKKFNVGLFILWFVFLLFSLSAIRNILYFAFVAAISIFYNANERFSYDKKLSNEKFSSNKYYFVGRYVLISAFIFCIFRNASINIESRYFDFETFNLKSSLWGINLRNFPKNAVDFILRERLPERMFNDFNSGSYLIGRSYPKRKVFIDGRTEFYGNEFLKTYKKATKTDRDSILRIINQYNLEGFILTQSTSNFDEQLAKFLFDDPLWVPVYFDEAAIIFLKKNKENEKLIKKFYVDLKSWQAPGSSLERIATIIVYPYKNIKRGIALKEIGCYKAAITEAQEALKIMPNCIDALEILGSSYLELGQYELAMENLRMAVALNPKGLDWRNKYALALYHLDYLKEAKEQLDMLFKFTPKDPTLFHALTLIYKKQNNLIAAEEAISNANQYSYNKNSEFLKLWADILFELKKYKEALSIYKKVQDLEKQDFDVKKKIKEIEKILSS